MTVYHHDNNGTECLIEEMGIPYFKDLLLLHSPKMIIELGTYKGGMTKYFSTWLPETV